MSAPPASDTCPLTAAVLPLSSVAPNNIIELTKLKALITQGLQLYRSSSTWPSSKTFNLDYESKVVASKGLSAQSGRLSNTAWHARRSEHSTSQSHKLTYQDFSTQLGKPENERQYIHEITKYVEVGSDTKVPSLQGDPSSKYIHSIQAQVWNTECE
jgi:hypothetical protein